MRRHGRVTKTKIKRLHYNNEYRCRIHSQTVRFRNYRDYRYHLFFSHQHLSEQTLLTYGYSKQQLSHITTNLDSATNYYIRALDEALKNFIRDGINSLTPNDEQQNEVEHFDNLVAKMQELQVGLWNED